MKNYLSQNSKIKAMSGIKTFNFGIPAFRSQSGLVTCPFAGKCAVGCYAKQGAYAWSNVREAYENRLKLSQSDSFVSVIDSEIKRRKIKRVRIHDSGDFYSPQYLKKWIDVINLNPETVFYAYTKSILFFRELTLPANFQVIFSEGGKLDHLIQSTDRHSRVFESEEELKNSDYVNASKDDSQAIGENHRIGLVYHGAKSKKWSSNENKNA